MFYLFFFYLEDAVPVFFFADFDVGLGLAFFVFEWAVQEDDAGVFYSSSHFRMSYVFVEHDAVEDLAVFDLATGDLFYSSISLDVYFFLAAANVMRDGPDCL